MSRLICVYGLWHLGCVTAACLASEKFNVIGLDPSPSVIDRLRMGIAPIAEPGLEELLRAGIGSGHLSFSSDSEHSLAQASIIWICFDTPVNSNDEADVEWVREQLNAIRYAVQPDTLILISSQVPVGFTRTIEKDWLRENPSLQFAYSPENLRLGQALASFRVPERVVIGLGKTCEADRLVQLFKPYTENVIFMSLESAELTKHAINAFLAMSVAYANEVGRICERIGANSREVEKGLRSEPRIGERAYVSAGLSIAGGTLIRDVAYLAELAERHNVSVPVFDAIRPSNAAHGQWSRGHLEQALRGVESPRVALLGLTYKPGTNTLRRSSALELAEWLTFRGIAVSAFDPAISEYTEDLSGISLAESAAEALLTADAAVIATAWPEFQQLTAQDFTEAMRTPVVIDQAGILTSIESSPGLHYIRLGRGANEV